MFVVKYRTHNLTLYPLLLKTNYMMNSLYIYCLDGYMDTVYVIQLSLDYQNPARGVEKPVG